MGQYGMIHTAMNGAPGESDAQIEISVQDAWAKSIHDVLARMIFDLDKFDAYEITECSENTIKVRETKEWFGEYSWVYHQGWLLDDGSFLYVAHSTTDEANRQYDSEIKVEFAAENGSEPLALMTDFDYARAGNDSLSGVWRGVPGEASENFRLDVFGNFIFLFKDEHEKQAAHARYQWLWKKLDLNGKELYVTADSEEEITIWGDGFPSGRYKPDAAARHSAGADTKETEYRYRGEWENDTIFCQLKIGRSSVTIGDNDSFSSGSYTESEDGLLFGETRIRPADDGGLSVDGYEGVFYRVGLGKGASRFADLAPYRGSWINKKTGMELGIQDGFYGTMDKDGVVGMGTCAVDGEGNLQLMGSSGHIDAESGHLIIGGIDGFFERLEVPSGEN
jgi:hypothetical protein